MAKKQIIIFPVAIAACLLLLLLLPTDTNSTERNFDKFVSQYYGYSPRQLSELSDNYVLSNKPDSAIAGYTMLVNEITGKKDKESLRMMAETYNKLGYIYLYEKGDNNSAYSYLLKSRDIAEENGYIDILSIVYLNLGNTILPSDEKEALSLFRGSLDNSLQIDAHGNANVAFLNMVNIAMSLDDRNVLMRILESYTPETADSIILSKYATLTSRGAKAFSEGHYAEAEAKLKEAAENIDTDLQPERYLLQALGNLVEVYRAAGDHRKMTDMLRNMEGLCSQWKVNDMLIEVYRNMAVTLASDGHAEEARDYEKKYLSLSDSLYSYRRGYELKNVETRHEVTKMNEKLQESDQISRNRLRILLIAVAAILALGIIVILVWRQKKRVDDLLLELYSRHRPAPLYGESTPLEASGIRKEASTAGNDPDPEVMETSSVDTEKPKEKYGASTLSDTEKSIYAEKITKTLEDSQEVFSQGFNIDRLAELAGIPTKTVSRVINETFGMNFNAFINTYRIREATERLESETSDSLTIDAISEELGFRNRSHFAAVFKASVGMSPSDFRRAARLKRMSTQ